MEVDDTQLACGKIEIRIIKTAKAATEESKSATITTLTTFISEDVTCVLLEATKLNPMPSIENRNTKTIIFAATSADFGNSEDCEKLRQAIDECVERKQKSLIIIYTTSSGPAAIEKLSLVSHSIQCDPENDPDLTEAKKRLHEILSRPIESLDSSQIVRLISQRSNPAETTDVYDIGNGLAWGYFVGFLVPLLKGFQERCTKFENDMKQTFAAQHLTVVPRYMIIFTQSFKNPRSLEQEDTRIQPLLQSDKTPMKLEVPTERNGVRMNKFLPVFLVKHPEDNKVYVIFAEYVTPQLVLKDAAESRATNLTFRHMREIGGFFKEALSRIIDSPSSKRILPASAAQSLAFVDYNDLSSEKHALSNLLVQKAKKYAKETSLIRDSVRHFQPVRKRTVPSEIFILHSLRTPLVDSVEAYLSSLQGLAVYSPKEGVNPNEILHHLYCARSVIVIISQKYLQVVHGEHYFLQLLRNTIKLLYSDMAERLNVVIVLENDVRSDLLPSWERGFNQSHVVESSGSAMSQTLGQIQDRLSCHETPIYSEPVNCGKAFAMNAFFGFLRILMTYWDKVIAENKIYKRYILIIPSKCRTFSLTGFDRRIEKLEPAKFEASRGGSSRTYRADVYQVSGASGTHRFSGEVVQPLIALAELMEHRVGDMTAEERAVHFVMQKSMFRDCLSQLLSAHCGKSRDFFEIIEYVEAEPGDSEHQPLSQVLLDVMTKA